MLRGTSTPGSRRSGKPGSGTRRWWHHVTASPRNPVNKPLPSPQHPASPPHAPRQIRRTCGFLGLLSSPPPPPHPTSCKKLLLLQSGRGAAELQFCPGQGTPRGSRSCSAAGDRILLPGAGIRQWFVQLGEAGRSSAPTRTDLIPSFRLPLPAPQHRDAQSLIRENALGKKRCPSFLYLPHLFVWMNPNVNQSIRTPQDPPASRAGASPAAPAPRQGERWEGMGRELLLLPSRTIRSATSCPSQTYPDLPLCKVSSAEYAILTEGRKTEAINHKPLPHFLLYQDRMKQAVNKTTAQ